MELKVAWWFEVLALGAIVFLAPAQRAEAQAKAPAAVDFSGTWRLNRELSDDEEAKLGAAATRAGQQPAESGPTGEAERQGSEGRQRGRAGGTSGRAAPGSSSPSVDENDPRGGRSGAGPPDTLTVTQAESEIVVREAPGRTRELYPNGKTYKTDEGAAQIRTSWKDGKLVVEKKNVHGWKLIETWEAAPDRARVFIHLLLEGGSGPKVTLTRVYDRDGASPPR
jgi:hypothetical protein